MVGQFFAKKLEQPSVLGELLMGIIFGNLCYGILSSIVTLVIIMSCNLTPQLFLYDSVSDAVKCSKPSEQTFKCSVYQNGQLVSSNTTNSNTSTSSTVIS
jgi:hypothetical protein